MRWEAGVNGRWPGPDEGLVAKLRRLAHWVVSGELHAGGDGVDGGMAEGSTDVDEHSAGTRRGRMKPPH